MAKLLDHLALDKVVVIGLSSAGGLVLEFALEHPERVLGVVASSPFVPGFEFSDEMMARLAAFNQAAGQGREPFLDRMLEDPHFIPAPLDPSVRAIAREMMAENFDKGAGFDASLIVPIEPPLLTRIEQFEVPVLLLAGQLDHPEVLRRNRLLLGRMTNAREVLIAESGHNTHLENPAEFLQVVSSFLAER